MYYHTALDIKNLKWVHRAVFLLETLGHNLFPCLFQLLRLPAFLGSWPFPPSLKPETASSILLPFYKDLCDYTQLTQKIQDHFLIPKSRVQAQLQDSFHCHISTDSGDHDLLCLPQPSERKSLFVTPKWNRPLKRQVCIIFCLVFITISNIVL